MLRKLVFGAALSAAVLLMSCGTSTRGPEGSMHQTTTGVSETGYPGRPVPSNDPQSPAVSASTETKYSQKISEPTAPKMEAEAKTEAR
jgi:hypothetical protein